MNKRRIGLTERQENFNRDEAMYHKLMEAYEKAEKHKPRISLRQRNNQQNLWVSLWLQKHPDIRKTYEEYLQKNN